jgi:hypothetical protein
MADDVSTTWKMAWPPRGNPIAADVAAYMDDDMAHKIPAHHSPFTNTQPILQHLVFKMIYTAHVKFSPTCSNFKPH